MLLFSTITAPASVVGHDRVNTRQTASGLISAVADGAGGAGGDAAAAAEQAVNEACGAAHNDHPRDPAFWAAFLADLDTRIAAAPHGGQTTLVVAEIRANTIVGASVGDSIAWLISHASIENLTEGAARKPLLGSGEAAPRPFGPIPFPPGPTLLLATDGLWKYAPREAIAAAVRALSISSRPEALTDLARLRSGALPDDVAAAVIRGT